MPISPAYSPATCCRATFTTKAACGPRARPRQELNTKGRMAVQAAFSEATAQAGVAASWRQGEDMPAECVVRHARHSDVLILGQENAGDVEAATGNDFVEQVLLSAGRPVIVLPTAGSFRNAGARCCTAGTRAASRPARSPTRRLRARQRAPDAGPRGPGRSGSAGFLRRPGRLLRQPRLSQLESEFRDAREAGIGDAILSAAADFGADLIVMGHTDSHAPMDHGRRHALAVGGDDLAGVFLTRRRRADAGKRRPSLVCIMQSDERACAIVVKQQQAGGAGPPFRR